jgi:hypothetical protein
MQNHNIEKNAESQYWIMQNDFMKTTMSADINNFCAHTCTPSRRRGKITAGNHSGLEEVRWYPQVAGPQVWPSPPGPLYGKKSKWLNQNACWRALVGAHALAEVQRIFITSKLERLLYIFKFTDSFRKTPEIGARNTVAAQVFPAVAVQQKL